MHTWCADVVLSVCSRFVSERTPRQRQLPASDRLRIAGKSVAADNKIDAKHAEEAQGKAEDTIHIHFGPYTSVQPARATVALAA